MIYDATALSTFRECPEKFRTRHLLALVPAREEEAPASGQAWHAGMREWFGAATSRIGEARAALIAAWGEEPLFRALPAKRPRGLFEALLDVYAAKWPRERDDFEVLRNETWQEAIIGKGWKGGIESASHCCDCGAAIGAAGTAFYGAGDGTGIRFRCEACNLVPRATIAYGGIVDRLIRLDGRTYVMDTKTTSGYLNDAYFAAYELSSQLRGYVALELVNGRECEGALIDAVHVDTRGGRAKPEHCLRYGPIRYDQARLSAWARDAEQTIGEIERLVAERGVGERWPQHDGACRNWGRLCPYFERCQVASELASVMPGYREERWEPQARGVVT